MKNNKWLGTLLLVLLLVGGGTLLLWRTGFFSSTASLADMKAYIDWFSPYSHLVFFGIQVASVIIAPIPSNITAAAGALLFGMWPSFFITAAAVLIGSTIVFWLARVLGKPFVSRFVSEKTSNKYLALIQRKRDVFLILVFLFPFFPDDLICILAGLTDISGLRFLTIAALTRPWGLLVACAFGGSATFMPTWAMALIGLAGVALFVVGLKFGDRWETTFLNRIKK